MRFGLPLTGVRRSRCGSVKSRDHRNHRPSIIEDCCIRSWTTVCSFVSMERRARKSIVNGWGMSPTLPPSPATDVCISATLREQLSWSRLGESSSFWAQTTSASELRLHRRFQETNCFTEQTRTCSALKTRLDFDRLRYARRVRVPAQRLYQVPRRFNSLAF